jgi:hypothetical protein
MIGTALRLFAAVLVSAAVVVIVVAGRVGYAREGK